MIRDLYLMWIMLYPLLSLIIFLMVLIMSHIKRFDKDINEVLKEFNNMLEEIHEYLPKFANLLKFIVEEALNGNMFPILLFLLTSCFIPVIRLVILKSMLTK